MIFAINLSILDFKAVILKHPTAGARPINLSILDFKGYHTRKL